MAGQQDVEQQHGARLVERVVLIAALGRLDARRAPGHTGPQPVLGGTEPPLCEAGSPRVAVIDEDGEQSGVGVQRGGDAADVPPVAGGHERQQADRAVLGCVSGAGTVGGLQAGGCHHVVGHRPPHSPGAQRARRQVEWLLRHDLTAGLASLEERDHLVAHVDVA